MLRLKSIRAMKVDSQATDSSHERSDKTFTAIVTMTEFFCRLGLSENYEKS